MTGHFNSKYLYSRKITSCTKCTRLTEFLQEHKEKNPDWWCRPVPGFGDPDAKLIILGLAPGLKGANRTGRPFTGDAAGLWLYRILYEKGLSSCEDSISKKDNLGLNGVYIANAVKCVPPGNKPTSAEVVNCRTHLKAEMKMLRQAKVILSLGKISHDSYLAFRKESEPGLSPKDFPFGHGMIHQFTSQPDYLIDSYHTSRQNTNTGRLTWSMWDDVFSKALDLAQLNIKK